LARLSESLPSSLDALSSFEKLIVSGDQTADRALHPVVDPRRLEHLQISQLDAVGMREGVEVFKQ
jgi:hypothetical protein